ncbi:MAG: hypothetical protein NTW49_13480 [Bacteroidia bacterium]|nr:hypothetical protein [Bacteroidia bacterium]
MKSIFIAFITVVCFYAVNQDVVFASVNNTNKNPGSPLKDPVIQDNKPVLKNLNTMDTIWYEGFANGMPAGWTVHDSTGNSYNWIFSTQGPTGAYTGFWPYPDSPISSTTYSNGFLMMPADFYNTTSSGTLNPNYIQMNAWVQTAAINCSGYSGVALRFQEKFRFCCNVSTAIFKVFVSNNGTSWTGYDVRDNVPENAISADPDTIKINISSVAANHATVYLRFYLAGVSHYYWMIDDIALVTAPANDLIMKSTKAWCIRESSTGAQSNDDYYSQIPVSQAMKMNFNGNIYNYGSNSEHNVNLAVGVTKNSQSVFTGQGNLGVIMPGVTQTINLVAPYFVPGSTGTYQVAYHTTQLENDENPADNSETNMSFKVSANTFARDLTNTSPVGIISYTGGADGDYIGVNYYNTYSSVVGSISVYVDATSYTGTSMIAKLYRYSG